MHIRAAAAQRHILLAGIDQPAIDPVRLGRRPHAKHAVLGMQDDFALGRQMISHLQRRADAEIDKPALGNIAGDARGHFVARARLACGKNVHASLAR